MKEFGIDKNSEINYSFLALGSNIGSRKKNLIKAHKSIIKNIGKIIKYSKIYETEPWGFNNQQKFLNQVIKIQTKHRPEELLNKLKKIEKKIGRIKSSKWGERLIDLDILYFNDKIINSNKLIIPHQYLHKRKFVLIPLNDINKEFKHPILKISNYELLNNCDDNKSVIEYGLY